MRRAQTEADDRDQGAMRTCSSILVIELKFILPHRAFDGG